MMGMCNLCVISRSLAPSKILPYCLGMRSFVHVILRCVARFLSTLANCSLFCEELIVSACFDSMKLFIVLGGIFLYAKVDFI